MLLIRLVALSICLEDQDKDWCLDDHESARVTLFPDLTFLDLFFCFFFYYNGL